MEAEPDAELSRDGDRDGRARRPSSLIPARLRRLFAPASRLAPVRALAARISRPTPFAAAGAIVTLAVVFIAGVTYYSAREFSGRATDTRASNEAMSFAEHSAQLATGDAFNGYIQILRYAEDPVVTAKNASANDRNSALQQLLYLNTNRFQSLTIADRSGLVLATTDSRIASVKDSAAFAETRANLSPANSDVILPEAGKRGYVEYTTPLHDTDGSTWAILVARADPSTLWKETLLAAVDGSQNVIINSQGQFSAGVPDELLRLPWHGQPLAGGGVHASIAGVDSICGLAPIGKDTQMDRGLNVASCLPSSIIQVERQGATGKQALITLAAVVFVIVAAAGGLRLVMRSGPRPEPATDDDLQALYEAKLVAALAEYREAEPPPPAELAPIVQAEPEPIPAADVDALTLIESYEARNARLADRLREQIQAKLLVATTQAGEAYRLADTDAALSTSLHERALAELRTLQERELRVIGQELYPGLVRLGLPAALRALKKDLADLIDVRLDVDPSSDAVGGASGRTGIPPALRLVIYRFVLDGVRVLALAGAAEATVSLRRDGTHVSFGVSGETAEGEAPDVDSLAANVISIEAYAGTAAFERDGGTVAIRVRVPAPAVAHDFARRDRGLDDDALPMSEDITTEPVDEGDAHAATDAGGTGDAAAVSVSEPSLDDDMFNPLRVVTLDEPEDELIAAFTGPARGLVAQLEALQAEFFGSIIVSIDVPASVIEADDKGDVNVYARSLAGQVVRAGLLGLRAADADRASVSVLVDGRMLVVSLTSEGGTEPAALDGVEALRSEITAADGVLSAANDGNALSITARIPAAAEGAVRAAAGGDGGADAA